MVRFLERHQQHQPPSSQNQPTILLMTVLHVLIRNQSTVLMTMLHVLIHRGPQNQPIVLSQSLIHRGP